MFSNLRRVWGSPESGSLVLVSTVTFPSSCPSILDISSCFCQTVVLCLTYLFLQVFFSYITQTSSSNIFTVRFSFSWFTLTPYNYFWILPFVNHLYLSSFISFTLYFFSILLPAFSFNTSSSLSTAIVPPLHHLCSQSPLFLVLSPLWGSVVFKVENEVIRRQLIVLLWDRGHGSYFLGLDFCLE